MTRLVAISNRVARPTGDTKQTGGLAVGILNQLLMCDSISFVPQDLIGPRFGGLEGREWRRLPFLDNYPRLS